MVKPITSETASLSVSEIRLEIVILEAGEMSLLLIQPQVVTLGFLERVRGAPPAHPVVLPPVTPNNAMSFGGSHFTKNLVYMQSWSHRQLITPA